MVYGFQGLGVKVYGSQGAWSRFYGFRVQGSGFRGWGAVFTLSLVGICTIFIYMIHLSRFKYPPAFELGLGRSERLTFWGYVSCLLRVMV